MNEIIIKGARENNLKNIDLVLPKNKLIVMTGLSGSGKSSLAFDTIYAEGQRRYVESLSAYARQFLGGTDKPEVDSIDGLSPAISIDQKTTNKNPRSTMGTITEIYDYLRLLFARVGVPYCPNHDIPVTSQSIEEMVNRVLETPVGTKLRILAPVVSASKGEHKELLEKLKNDGFVRVRINGEEKDLSDDIELEKNKRDNIEVIVDRLVMKEDIRARLHESIELATNLANGRVIIDIIGGEELIMSEMYACNLCDFSLPKLEPRMFSFNAPFGACPECNGLAVKLKIDPDLLIPDKSLSIAEGGIKSTGTDQDNIYFKKLAITCKYYKISITKPIEKLKKKELDIVLYGSPDIINFNFTSRSGNSFKQKGPYEGVIGNLERRYMETNSNYIRDWISNYMDESVCDVCNGSRLNEKALSVRVAGKNIYQMTQMSITDLYNFFLTIELNKTQKVIAELIIKEILERTNFLINVGLTYLSLDRTASTLSGGEAQRIRLATQIGSRLTGVLYVLDEPSIGLHQRDNERLINSLLNMRDSGNTLIVVEHDTDTMLKADYLVDIGPKAGAAGGHVVAAGTPLEVMKNKDSITGKYLTGELKIAIPKKRRKGNGKKIKIFGAEENNLQNINVTFPLGTLTCVTGVSGSGKSSLVNEILYKALHNEVYRSKVKAGKHRKITGAEHIDKIVDISQSPIGRTPRSNPATYTGVFDNIRDIFALTKESKIRGYKKGRFSFNIKGGRCEACNGDGVMKIEMHFLPDVYVPCEVCNGSRYNSQTLSIKYKGKNISEVLNMQVEEATEFFKNVPKISNKLNMLMDVGLNYIKLGQSSITLSGGEAARIKLAKELQKKTTGKSIFILDEPTTGLHSHDIKRLLVILNRIVDNGDTVVIIEHNLDVIKVADHVIDIGIEGGDGGGDLIFAGTPEKLCLEENSHTGKFLKNLL